MKLVRFFGDTTGILKSIIVYDTITGEESRYYNIMLKERDIGKYLRFEFNPELSPNPITSLDGNYTTSLDGNYTTSLGGNYELDGIYKLTGLEVFNLRKSLNK